MRATFEEGTEILLDSEALTLSAGWTEAPANGCDVMRNGQVVTLLLRCSNAAKAAAQIVAALPPQYRPAMNVLDPTGKIEVLANGEVISKRTPVELEAVVTAQFQIAYRAATTVP